MTFVEQVMEGFKARMIATFYYSTLPFAAVPEFFDKIIALASSEKTDDQGSTEKPDEHIINFLAVFMPVMAVIGDIFLITIGLISLVLASVAALLQTLVLPFELMVAGIQDGQSSEEEYIPDTPDNQEPGVEQTEHTDYQAENEDQYQENYTDGEQYQQEQDTYYQPEETDGYQTGDTGYYQHGNNFWSQKPEKPKPFSIDPVLAEEFLRKYGTNF